MPGLQDAIADPDFQTAQPADQIAYLSHIDPDFAKANASDQQSYINRILNPERQARAAAPTQFEQERTPQGSSLERLGSGAWSGLKAMVPPIPHSIGEGIGELNSLGESMTPLGMARGFATGMADARQKGQGLIPSVGAGLGTMAGLDVPGIRERAQRGDVAGVAGEGIPAIGATLLGGESGRLKEPIAEAMRTEEGTLKPGVRRAAQLGGALGGRFLGSELAGYFLGPGVADSLIPERAPQTSLAGEPMSYEQKARTLMTRGKQQAAIDRQAGRIPSAGTETGGLPEGVMHVPEPNPLAPGEKPGSMYSVPREELAAAAQRSKPGAIDVLRDLGRPMIVIPKGAGEGYSGARIPSIEEEETPELLRRAAD